MRPLPLICAALLSVLLPHAAAAGVVLKGGPCLPLRTGDAWVETWIEVQNSGEAEIRGTIEAELVAPRLRGPRASRQIAVAPGARKRFHLLLYAGFGSRGDFEFRFRDAGGDLVARSEESGAWQQGLLQTLVVLAPADRRPSIVAALTDKKLGALGLSRWEAEPAALPETWEGWTSAGLVVASETDFSLMSEEQRRALHDWVTRGGRILLLPGTDPSWLEQPAVQAFAPTGKVSEGEEPHTLRAYFPGGVPERSYRFERPGEPALQARRVDAVVSRYRLGTGAAVVCGFDANHPSLRQATADLAKFSTDLLEAVDAARSEFDAYSTERGYYAWAEFSEAIGEGLVEYPPTGWLVLALFVYIGITGPLNFFVLRRRHAPALTVVTVPILGIGATALLLATGWALRERDIRANRVTVLRPVPGSTMATVQEHILVGTGQRRTVQVASSVGRLAAMTDGHGYPRRDVAYGGPEGRVLTWPFEPREPAYLYGVGFREFGAVRATLDSTQLILRNETAQDFSYALYLEYGTRSRRLGPVPAGGTIRVAERFSTNANPFAPPITDEDPAFAILLRSMADCLFDIKVPLVIAVIAGDIPPPTADGKPIRLVRDVTLVLIPVERVP